VVAYQGSRIIGIDAAPRFEIPFNIAVDTSGISGPSAGLAMTLAIIDGLTPGDLTGGKRVAVTGTISPNGDVGEIGGLPQKAVAAKAAHAQIFIVPVCVHDPGCDADLKTAKARVGKDVDVEPVATLAQALAILRKAGGAPLPAKTKT
jgi:PDZ domain-containing protein